MKDRIVIWGQDEKDTDVLIAIRLLQNSDIIKIWTFPKKGIDETFVDSLFKDWKDGAEDKFPQPYTLVERGITEENMLPEGLKTPKTDVIKIAEQEWRVRVLSFRLYEHIKQQIEQLKVRVGNLSVYSKDVWEEAKDVSRSIKENTLDRNIKREQTTELRKGIDEVFDEMKKLQNAEQAKYLENSKNNMVAIRAKVSEVLEKIGTERHTKKLWDKLLAYQQEAKGQEMTPRDRNSLRLSFNEAFGALKADIQSNVGNRLNSRINGLKSAIGKMEASIKRDKDNIAYQSGRINKNNTTQLEYQLRSAKLKLIEDRIQSKEQKLHNMYLTLKDLEKKTDKLPKAKKVIKAKPAATAAPAVGKDKDVASTDKKVDNDEKVVEGSKAEEVVDNVAVEPKVSAEAKQNIEVANAVESTENTAATAAKKEDHQEVKAEAAEVAVDKTTPESELETKVSTEEAKQTIETSNEQQVAQNTEAIAKKEDSATVVQEAKVEPTAEVAEKVSEQKVVEEDKEEVATQSVDASNKTEVSENAVATPKEHETSNVAQETKTEPLEEVDDKVAEQTVVKNEVMQSIEPSIAESKTENIEASTKNELSSNIGATIEETKTETLNEAVGGVIKDENVAIATEQAEKTINEVVDTKVDEIIPSVSKESITATSIGASIITKTVDKPETIDEVQAEEETNKSEPNADITQNKTEEE